LLPKPLLADVLNNIRCRAPIFFNMQVILKQLTALIKIDAMYIS
jgi:hypothetical protein